MESRKEIIINHLKDWAKGREYFCPDGFLDSSYKGDIKILFLLKESDEKRKVKEIKDYTDFWASRMVTNTLEKNKENDDVSSSGNRIMNRLKWIRENICEAKKESEDDADKPYDCLRDCAFMNINKNGGGAVADIKTIRDAASTDEENIKKEIRIINPSCIVAMGAGMDRIIEKYIKLENVNEKTPSIVYLSHPSRRWSWNKFKEEVESKLGKN